MTGERTVVIVGAGIAGTAAALAAARLGAQVTIVDGGTGATTLATGALDPRPWDQQPPAQPMPLPASARAALDALGGYSLPDAGSRLATTAGIVRPARGHDAALLDVRPPGITRVGVVHCRRPGWDATSLARAWGERFEPLQAMIVRHVDERWLPDADFAARHDDEARLGWLAERLRDALAPDGARFQALVLPPCLGIERARAATLTKLVGLSCGEALGLPGGPSGLRFESGRDRALTAAGVVHVLGRVRRVTRRGMGWSVGVDDAGLPPDAIEGAAVVLAAGGLLGGGLEYCPPETMHASALPPFARHPFRLTLAAPVELGADGRPLELPSTLFGASPESISWPFARSPLVDRAGVLADEDGRAGVDLFAAGELLADRPRTWLDALTTGARAGAAAARRVITEAVGPSTGAVSASRS